jgi:hypothetical protein
VNWIVTSVPGISPHKTDRWLADYLAVRMRMGSPSAYSRLPSRPPVACLTKPCTRQRILSRHQLTSLDSARRARNPSRNRNTYGSTTMMTGSTRSLHRASQGIVFPPRSSTETNGSWRLYLALRLPRMAHETQAVRKRLAGRPTGFPGVLFPITLY